jgi:hypothetical protein
MGFIGSGRLRGSGEVMVEIVERLRERCQHTNEWNQRKTQLSILEQGIEKGRLLERRRQERLRRQEIRRMHAHQIPLDIICEIMSVTPEYVQKVLAKKG